ncbi:MAG: hypothetical protein EHM35_17635 [Planctomycetaceae bacterium]|nr:MAG: hypothetical protein EHM35_17635 [Planctomycetaceae bacterium]
MKFIGGYAGTGEVEPDDRDPQLYPTVLTGDLKDNDAENSNLPSLPNDPTRSDDSTYVIVSQNNDSSTLLDGFVITAGARSGLNCAGSSLVVVDCVFQHNATAFDGGAVHQETSGVATFTRCTFTENYAKQHGGAIYTQAGITLTDCAFVANEAGMAGAAVYNAGGNTVMTGCTFTRNAATADGAVEHIGGWLTARNCTFTDNSGKDGGAVRLLSGHTEFADCLFENNSASMRGGALFYDGGSSESIHNCIFRGNSAENGGALFGFGRSTIRNCVFENNSAKSGGAASADCHAPNFVHCVFFANRADDGVCVAQNTCSSRSVAWVTITSCILWDSGGVSVAQTSKATATSRVTYSLIQGGSPGEGNIDADPLFAIPGRWDPNGTRDITSDDVWISGDYHLRSQAGRWDPLTKGWVADDVTSPCIDGGDPASSIGLEPFPNGGVINTGIYGGTAESSKSYFGKPVCQTIIPGDINGDCRVDMADLEIMMSHWLEDANPSQNPPHRR